MERKKFKELNLSNAFLFAAALADEETCGIVLELILGKKFPKVTVRTEHTVLFSSDFRSVRFDVYAKDEAEVSYNLEMENKNRGNLPKRVRYHQAEMDVTSLKPGENFNDLQPSYVIFICRFDPFGDGLYQYTFEERCLENNRLLGDGTVKIFLNIKGENSHEVPKALVDFLKYVENSTDIRVNESSNISLQKLHEKVLKLKESRELEENFMYLTEWLEEEIEDSRTEARAEGRAEGREEGREEGRTEARNQLLELIKHMVDANEQELIPSLTIDPAFFEEMLKKYHL